MQAESLGSLASARVVGSAPRLADASREKVAVTGRSPDALQVIADEIVAAGGQAIPAVGDAQQEARIVDILDRLVSIGPVEVGVYNAGNAIWGPPLETKTADFETIWRVGCLGGFIFGREIERSISASSA